MCVLMRVHVCAHVHAEPGVDIQCLLHLSTLSFETGLSLNLKLTDWL